MIFYNGPFLYISFILNVDAFEKKKYEKNIDDNDSDDLNKRKQQNCRL